MNEPIAPKEIVRADRPAEITQFSPVPLEIDQPVRQNELQEPLHAGSGLLGTFARGRVVLAITVLQLGENETTRAGLEGA
jgi:hypothetical protein